jgi:hypothetical protein
MEKKYLSDGRKVVIVGKLNNQESIVQEVFITESGDEVPSGERFVVKSLHDTPVISYKEKRVQDAEKTLETLSHTIKSANIKCNDAQARLKGISEILRTSERLLNIVGSAELKTLSQFMTGSIEYLVYDEYTIKPPMKMIDEIINYDNSYYGKRYTGIKLLSLLGKSDGSLEYKIHAYHNGSGNVITVMPFCTIEEAHEHIKTLAEKRIKEGRLNEESYKNCIEMGIVFDKELIEKYKRDTAARKSKDLDGHIKELSKKKDIVNRLKSEIEDLTNTKGE